MTYIEDGTLVIEEEQRGYCAECGKFDELRPYGDGGARICWDCGQKDPEATERNMVRVWARQGVKVPS
jgi:hypothetical protein